MPISTKSIICASPDAPSELVAKIEACGTLTGYGWRVYCHQAGCDKCRRYRLAQVIDKAKSMVGDRPRDAFKMMSIDWRPVSDIQLLKSEIDCFRQRIRNVLFRMGQKDKRWTCVKVIGVIEIDYYSVEDIVHIMPDKKVQLDEFGTGYGSFWWPHMHSVVDLGEVTENEFKAVMDKAWTIHNQFHIQDIRDDDNVVVEIENVMSYAAKFNHGIKVGLLDGRKEWRSWPESAVVDFYSYIQSVGGMKLLCFEYGLRKKTVHNRNPPGNQREVHPLDEKVILTTYLGRRRLISRRKYLDQFSFDDLVRMQWSNKKRPDEIRPSDIQMYFDEKTESGITLREPMPVLML